jgi:hypothetical protein
LDDLGGDFIQLQGQAVFAAPGKGKPQEASVGGQVSGGIVTLEFPRWERNGPKEGVKAEDNHKQAEKEPFGII